MMHAPTISPARQPDTARADVPIAIEVRDLTRSFRKRKGWLRSGELVEAVRGISFTVPEGTIFGVLGPNGAGKTTTIKMLSTLLLPTSGAATINGFDIVRDEHRVRSRLGVLFGGDKGLYNQLTAWENLRYFGRLYGMSDALIAQRAEELLERVRLADRAGERVESYSRGMKQRLHIAKTLIHDPRIVILDEPTIGLDPGAAIGVRELIADLVPDHTVLLTTHDMHEADILCRELAIIDRGLIVAEGTPAALKAATALERRVALTLGTDVDGLLGRVRPHLERQETILHTTHRLDAAGQAVLELVCTDTTTALDETLALLREHGASVRAIDIREPSLEDAFLRATGREFEDAAASGDETA
ncbi:MAG TPA: ABC transporter ATP-binding protein [Thermomicrobiales bacterium]|nr:ABC transporter ATP-binding protein [Thermomicrobiales bacterium]